MEQLKEIILVGLTVAVGELCQCLMVPATPRPIALFMAKTMRLFSCKIAFHVQHLK